MKVCFVSHTADLGGAERSLLQLIRGLKDRGVECFVCLPKDGPLEKELSGIADTIRSSYSWWTVPRGRDRKDVKSGLIKHIQDAIALSKILQKERFDILLTNTSVVCEGAIAARILGIPHLWYIRELGEKDHGFIFKFGLKNTGDLINELSDRIFLIPKPHGKNLRSI